MKECCCPEEHGHNFEVYFGVDVLCTFCMERRDELEEWPLPEPPEWGDVEWCDEGASCEHPRCLELLDEEYEGWVRLAEIEAQEAGEA